MKMIIVGAGPVGNSLAQLAHKHGYDVIVIEPNRSRAEDCLEKLDVVVLNSSIGAAKLAEEAGFDQCAVLVATSTDDAENIMAVLLAKEHGIERLVSMVNVAEHRSMFDRLGVETLVDPEILMAQHLFDRIELPEKVRLETLQDNAQIVEILLGEGSVLIGKTMRQTKSDKILPEEACAISVTRDGKRFFPFGKYALAKGDSLLLFSYEAISPKKMMKLIGDSE